MFSQKKILLWAIVQVRSLNFPVSWVQVTFHCCWHLWQQCRSSAGLSRSSSFRQHHRPNRCVHTTVTPQWAHLGLIRGGWEWTSEYRLERLGDKETYWLALINFYWWRMTTVAGLWCVISCTSYNLSAVLPAGAREAGRLVLAPLQEEYRHRSRWL